MLGENQQRNHKIFLDPHSKTVLQTKQLKQLGEIFICQLFLLKEVDNYLL